MSNKKNNQRQFLLGIFFIIALSILAFYTLFLTDVHLFSQPHYETVYFPDAYGLREGNPVLLLGSRIGKVKSIDPQTAEEPRKRIKVVLSLDTEIELLENAKVTIKESTLLGGRHVDIYPGDFGGPPLVREDDGALFGQVEKNPIASLSDLGNLFTDNREAIRDILANLDTLVAGIKDGRGTLGRFLVDEAMSQDVADSVASIKTVTADIESGKGLLGALINDPELIDSVKTSLESLQTISSDLQAGKGIAGRLIYDEALADEVAKAIEAFSNVGQKIDRGEGVAGRLLSSPEMAAELDAIVANFKQASEDLQAVTSQVRAGEGTVGKLVMNQELYDDALSAVGVLTRSLEDYREAAPITALTAVFFAAF